MGNSRTSIDKLDDVLYIISSIGRSNNPQEAIFKYDMEVLDMANENFPSQMPGSITYQEFTMILEKLKRDGFIYLEQIDLKIACLPNFDGKIFMEQGGYSQRLKNEKAITDRSDRLEEFQKDQAEKQMKISERQTALITEQTINGSRQTTLMIEQAKQSKIVTLFTIIIAFGTAIAAIYYTQEINKNFEDAESQVKQQNSAKKQMIDTTRKKIILTK